jgi:hypothetical protein
MPENEYNDQIHRSMFTHKVAQAKEASSAAREAGGKLVPPLLLLMFSIGIGKGGGRTGAEPPLWLGAPTARLVQGERGAI